MAVGKTPVHRWLPGIATAALVAVVATVPASAAAARHSPAAVGARQPPGYTIVNRGPFDAPPGTVATFGFVLCPTGTVVWGGGVAFLGGVSPRLTISYSAPNGTAGWAVRVNNTGTTTAQFGVDAVCADRPADYLPYYQSVNNPPNTQSHVTAACPAGTVLFGGGTLSNTQQVGVVLTSAWPRGPVSFTGYEFNGTATRQNFTVSAICGQRPAGYKIVTNSASVAPRSTLSDVIGCPAGTSVLGGGVQDPGHVRVVQVAGSIDQGASGWAFDVINNGPLAHKVNGYAICAA